MHTIYLLPWWHPQRAQGKVAQGGIQDFLLNNTILFYNGQNLEEKTRQSRARSYPIPYHFCIIAAILQYLCYDYRKKLINVLKKVCIVFLHFVNLVGIYLAFNHIQIKVSLFL